MRAWTYLDHSTDTGVTGEDTPITEPFDTPHLVSLVFDTAEDAEAALRLTLGVNPRLSASVVRTERDMREMLKLVDPRGIPPRYLRDLTRVLAAGSPVLVILVSGRVEDEVLSALTPMDGLVLRVGPAQPGTNANV